MAGLIDIDRLYSVGVVVRDLASATRRYAELLGIDQWEVRELGPDRLTAASCHGRPVQPVLRTATGVTADPGGGMSLMGNNPQIPVRFELIEPVGGESPFAEFNFVRGPGISHLTLAVRDPEAFARLQVRLEQEGLGLAGSFTVDGVLERHFVDTRDTLGGFLVEVQVPLTDSADPLPVTERWDQSGSYTRPGAPLHAHGVNHFGVVVPDVMKALPHYARILGIPTWKMRDWRTEKDRLENPHYRGAPVDHEYFTARAQVADFGFEVIQPTLGPSHYNRDFLDRWGAGIHHALLHVTEDAEEWEQGTAWLASVGVPVVMDAELYGRSIEFAYLDTTQALGGYVVESVFMKGESDPATRAPDFVVDFSR